MRCAASWKADPRRLTASGLLIAALWATPAPALERSLTVPGGCIAGITSGNGIGGGISVPGPRGTVFVQLCDGRRMRLGLRDGGLTLAPARTPGPAVPMPAPGTLPDGETTRGTGIIVSAWLTGPTGIYAHGILGNRIEASGFRINLRDGGHRELLLGTRSVFEDLRARLVDLDGDGTDEIVVIRSYLDSGAALAVYGLTPSGIRRRGESKPIGLPHRWLNPAGAADFDGDGKIEIAHVETPHIGGIIRVHELTKDGLRLKYSAHGFSNHSIGSRVLDMSAVIDWNADGIPDLAVPDASRRRVRVVSFANGRFSDLATLRAGAEIKTALVAADLDGDGKPEIIYGRSDGTVSLTER